jgi:hypothetical protein
MGLQKKIFYSRSRNSHVRLQVIAISLKIRSFWDATPSSLINKYTHFKGTCFHPQSIKQTRGYQAVKKTTIINLELTDIISLSAHPETENNEFKRD